MLLQNLGGWILKPADGLEPGPADKRQDSADDGQHRRHQSVTRPQRQSRRIGHRRLCCPVQQVSGRQGKLQGSKEQASQADAEHRCTNCPLAELHFDLPPRQLKLLLDEVLQIAKDAAHQ
jgi:hypothetical protein